MSQGSGRTSRGLKSEQDCPAELFLEVEPFQEAKQWKDQGLYRPSFNIGPGATTPVLTRNKSGERELQCMVWGIRLNSTTVINARSETLTEKATFKKLVNNNRCIVVVEGYYEWAKRKSGKKQPYFFRFPDHQILPLAALYEVRSSPSGVPTLYFTIITVPAHESFSAVHDRMPAVIPHDLIDVWLGDDLGLALSLLVPRGELDWFPVSNLVSSMANDSEKLLVPLDPVALGDAEDAKAYFAYKGIKKEEIEQQVRKKGLERFFDASPKKETVKKEETVKQENVQPVQMVKDEEVPDLADVPRELSPENSERKRGPVVKEEPRPTKRPCTF